jgi:co-chaperonin GroES (HSP10)
MIQPLGEQIIIKIIPQNSVGSIIIPDSAKGITMMGAKGSEDAVHFVEAEVIAVGPGKRGKGDPTLVRELADALDRVTYQDRSAVQGTGALIERARNPLERIPLIVKPGDRILYHPSVQRFDRKVEGLGEGEYFIIREESVLAVIEQ